MVSHQSKPRATQLPPSAVCLKKCCLATCKKSRDNLDKNTNSKYKLRNRTNRKSALLPHCMCSAKLQQLRSKDRSRDPSSSCKQRSVRPFKSWERCFHSPPRTKASSPLSTCSPLRHTLRLWISLNFEHMSDWSQSSPLPALLSFTLMLCRFACCRGQGEALQLLESSCISHCIIRQPRGLRCEAAGQKRKNNGLGNTGNKKLLGLSQPKGSQLWAPCL